MCWVLLLLLCLGFRRVPGVGGEALFFQIRSLGLLPRVGKLFARCGEPSRLLTAPRHPQRRGEVAGSPIPSQPARERSLHFS